MSGWDRPQGVGEVSISGSPGRRRNWFAAGGWYFLVTVVSLGLLAWVPFAHAASRLARRSTTLWAWTYAAGAVLVVVLLAGAPVDARGEIVGTTGNLLASLGVLLMLAMIALGCVQQALLRRQVYYGQAARPTALPAAGDTDHSPAADPAVAAVLTARARRDEARKLAAGDALMARELGIGRPDLPRQYDDGGLVDLNGAPQTVIAEVCDVDTATAARIVAARTECGGFLAVDDVFTLTDIPLDAWDRIRDRGIVVTP